MSRHTASAAEPCWAVGSVGMGASCAIYVSDVDRMSSFYERCLWLAMVDQGVGYRVLESDVWTLSLVQVGPDVAATVDLSLPARRPGGGTDQAGVPGGEH
jgi:hypothetical protein